MLAQLGEEWPLWRLVLAKVATWEELNRAWSWDEIELANAALDYQQEVERRHYEKTR